MVIYKTRSEVRRRNERAGRVWEYVYPVCPAILIRSSELYWALGGGLGSREI